jgi:histidine triad (HIT) family protein
MNSCVFCRIIARELPSTIIGESDTCIVINDIAPKAPIHMLIIPKEHHADIKALPDVQIGRDIFALAQELARTVPGAEEFKLVINNGHAAGQRVFHLHAHYLAGGQLSDL